MKNDETKVDALTFDQFTLFTKPGRLLKDGVEVKLRRQALRLLNLLVRRAGELVSHEDIRVALWGERYVNHVGGTHLLVREIRQALGDSASNPRFIETLPREGYRFIADASELRVPDSGTVFSNISTRVTLWRVGAAAAIGAIVVLLSVIFGGNVDHRNDIRTKSAAQEAYLKGDYLYTLGGNENLIRAAEFFTEALELDDSHADAHAGMALISAARGDFDTAETYAKTGLELDADLVKAHNVLAWVAINRDWDWKHAQSVIERSLALDRDNPRTHNINAWLMIIVGQRADAKNAAQTAFDLDPVSSLVRTDNGWFHYYVGDYASGLQICTEAINLDPNNRFAIRCQFKSALLVGDYVVASLAAAEIAENWGTAPEIVNSLRVEPGRDSLRRFFDHRRRHLMSKQENSEVSPVQLAVAYAEMGDFEDAAASLALEMESPSPQLPYILRDPALLPIHEDPRYLAAVKFTEIPN